LFKRALPVTALVASFVLLPLVAARAQADDQTGDSLSCHARVSILNAQAARLPHSVVRLSADSIRDVEQDSAGRPENALQSVAVNVRNACGGEIVLPDLSVLTLDPHALRGDRLVRISQLPSKSYLVELSPPDTHFPTSLPARTSQFSTRYGHEPAIALGYVLPGASLPTHIAAQSYMNTSKHHLAKSSQPVSIVAQGSVKVTPMPVLLATPAPKPIIKPSPIAAMPISAANMSPGTIRTTANIRAGIGGTIKLNNDIEIIIGAGILPADAAVTLEYTASVVAPPTTEEYASAPGVLSVIFANPDSSAPAASAPNDADFTGSGVRIVFKRPATMTGDNLGLSAVRARYRSGGQDEQQVSSVQAHGDDIAADFSGAILQSRTLGKRVWFSVQEYVAGSNF
jgi:hypothetical protein